MLENPRFMGRFLNACRQYFIFAGIFSLFINLLMLTTPIYMLQVFDRVLSSRSNETLIMLILVAMFALLVMQMLDLIRSRLLLGAGIALDNMLGPAVVDGLLRGAAVPGSAGKAFVAGLRDVAIVRSFLTGSSITSLFDSPWVPIYVLIIFMFHPYMGVLALLGALTLLVLAWVNEQITRAPIEEMSRQTRIASRYIDTSIRNAELIHALGAGGNIVRHWQQANDRVIDAQLVSGLRGNSITGMTRLVRLSLQILALGLGAYLVIDNHMSSGVMMAGTLILARALAPVETAITTWKSFVDARESWMRLDDLLKHPAAAASPVDVPVIDGRLDVERVIFSIPGTDRMILKGITFSLAPGEALGVIGPSAAGKSTLARLITGIWKPNSGVVRFSGGDVSAWPREQLGPLLGYLPQDVELFSGSVAENIARMGEVDSEKVVAAAQAALAHEMILRLPKGYDTEIGDAGAILSGGQRQRVALARALYGNPRLVVLDEPNASLDNAGEEALVEAIRVMKGAGMTVVVISHRPSTLAGVDKLLVLRDGAVEAFGPRAEVQSRFVRAPVAAPAPAETPHLVSARLDR